MRFLLLVLVSVLVFVQAGSLDRTRTLAFVSAVHDLTVSDPGSDSVTVSLRLPHNKRYTNVARRWWALSDPNNWARLAHRKPLESVFGDVRAVSSHHLFDYLTRNASTIESPHESSGLEFRLVLSRHPDIVQSDCVVYTTDSRGQLVLDFNSECTAQMDAYDGTAYRKVYDYRVADGSISSRYEPVGWARLVVDSDGQVTGTWKVSDESLGAPPAVYHLENVHSLARVLTEAELPLLAKADPDNNLVVWRDLDMRSDPTIHEVYSFTREDDFAFVQDEDYFEERRLQDLGHGPTMVKRDQPSDPEPSSGFSSGVNLYDTIGDSSGCPEKRQVALIGIAADCNFVGQFNSSSEARRQLIATVNSASQVWESAFNISLGLKALVLANSSQCPATQADAADTGLLWNYACTNDPSSTPINDRLSLVSEWRGMGNRSQDGLSTWAVFTSCSQDAIVGLSWQGLACTASASEQGNNTFVAGANVVTHTSLDWRVLAHEIGHTFGAVHDCTSDTCAQGLNNTSGCCPFSTSTCDAGGVYIMNPAASDSQDGFSACSVGNVCTAIGRSQVNATCLTSNRDLTLVTANECGNGIVEAGEDCDCGGVEGCAGNKCCDPTTCRFLSGAQCDDSNDVCCQSCQFASNTTVCRPAQGPCDPAEMCPGTAAACPADVHAPDGQHCSTTDSSLQCISGHCTSRNMQCLVLLQNTTLTVGGQVVNVTGACGDDSSCRLSCVDDTHSTLCFVTGQNFLDGTPCRGSGRCQRGVCVGGHSGGGLGSGGGGSGSDLDWFSNHRAIVIGVVVGVAGVVLLGIAWRTLVTVRHRHAMLGQLRTANQARRKPPSPQLSTGPVYSDPYANGPGYTSGPVPEYLQGPAPAYEMHPYGYR